MTTAYLDVVISNEEVHQTRLWSPKPDPGRLVTFPSFSAAEACGPERVRFGIFRPDGHASLLFRTEHEAGAWSFDAGQWVLDKDLLNGLAVEWPADSDRPEPGNRSRCPVARSRPRWSLRVDCPQRRLHLVPGNEELAAVAVHAASRSPGR